MKLSAYILAAFVALVSGTSFAAQEFAAYSKPAFEQAQAESKPVIVHVHADWCSTCAKQVPALSKILNDPSLAGVEALRVNYDKDRDFLMMNRIPNQSVILVFKNGKEVLRMNGVTDATQMLTKIKSVL